MKSRIHIFLISLLFPLSGLLAAPYAVFNHKIFYVPEKGPVVETYFDIYGKSITLKDQGENFLQGEVVLTVIFKKGSEIITYDKKNLKSPVMTYGDIVDFIDVQRFAVPPGEYTLEIEMVDANAESDSSTKASLNISVPQPSKGAYFSDLQFVSAYKKTEEPSILSKSGYDLLPMVADSILKSGMKELVVYAEVYNTDKRIGTDDMFLVSTFMATADSLKPVESTRKFMRKSTSPVTPILTVVPIDDLPAGNYELIFEARTRENELIARVTKPVIRSKAQAIDVMAKVSDEDMSLTWVGQFKEKNILFEHVQSLRPIAEHQERSMLENYFYDVDKTSLEQLRTFFYAFWETRDASQPEAAWKAYKEKVDFVQEEFGTRNKRGYETDRGRVYLEYGPPNDIADRPSEPNSYPYQIWRYYKAKQYNNVRFVFFDPTLMGTDYQLLHVEGARGEVNNPQWRILLQQRNNVIKDPDNNQTEGQFGGRADDYFQNPR